MSQVSKDLGICISVGMLSRWRSNIESSGVPTLQSGSSVSVSESLGSASREFLESENKRLKKELKYAKIINETLKKVWVFWPQTHSAVFCNS